MSFEALAAISEFIGAMGVIVSLAYLARQLKRKNQLVRLAARDEVIRQLQYWAATVAMNKDASSLFFKGNLDINNLNEIEKGQFILLMYSFSKQFENIFLQYCDGLIEKDVWDRSYAVLGSYLQQNGAQHYLKYRIEIFDPRFQVILKDLNKSTYKIESFAQIMK